MKILAFSSLLWLWYSMFALQPKPEELVDQKYRLEYRHTPTCGTESCYVLVPLED